MNGRPTTITFPDLLQRPLLWAGLCSIVLHLPVLLLVSQILQNQQQVTDGMVLTLLPRAEQGPEPEQQLISEQAHPPTSASEGHPLPTAQVAASVDQPAFFQTPSVQDPSAQTAVNTTPAVPTPSSQTSPAPVVTKAPISMIKSLPALLPPWPMAERDITQLQLAINSLVDGINEPGTLSDLLSPTQLVPESLGLPASDRITVSSTAVKDMNSLQQIDITVTREINGQFYQTRVRLQERALSHYATFINRWDDNVVLSKDRIDGRFHVNSSVNFETSAHARPTFNGEVTIAGSQSLAWRVRQSTMFAGGIRTGIGRIALPQEALSAHWLHSGATVLTLISDTRLNFQGNHGIVLTDSNSRTQTHTSVPEAGLMIVSTGRSRIELSGTIAGRVLVYSPRQLMIVGSLVYQDTTMDSSDTLALISDGSIDIAAASVTGGGDLEIHGALYARQRFSVRQFRDRHQGTLHVFGVLVAGSVSATEPRFNTHIEYDPRFDHSRPPAFPSTGLFDLVAWDQHWTSVNGPDALIAGAADNAAIAGP